MKRALEAMYSWAHSQQPKSQRSKPSSDSTDARRRKISQQMVDHIARQRASSKHYIKFAKVQSFSVFYQILPL